MDEVMELNPTETIARELINPKEEGMGPVSELLCRFMNVTDFRLPMDEGMEDVMEVNAI